MTRGAGTGVKDMILTFCSLKGEKAADLSLLCDSGAWSLISEAGSLWCPRKGKAPGFRALAPGQVTWTIKHARCRLPTNAPPGGAPASRSISPD